MEMDNEEVVRLQMENAELKGRIMTLEKDVEDARGAVSGYLKEIENCAIAAKALMEQCEERQREGDRLRVQLGKALDAVETGHKLIEALGAVHISEKAWESLGTLGPEYVRARERLKE